MANAKIAYAGSVANLQGERWKLLEQAGRATPADALGQHRHQESAVQRHQVRDSLIGPDTVNTMTTETSAAFADHGAARTTLQDDPEPPHAVMDALATSASTCTWSPSSC